MAVRHHPNTLFHETSLASLRRNINYANGSKNGGCNGDFYDIAAKTKSDICTAFIGLSVAGFRAITMLMLAIITGRDFNRNVNAI